MVDVHQGSTFVAYTNYTGKRTGALLIKIKVVKYFRRIYRITIYLILRIQLLIMFLIITLLLQTIIRFEMVLNFN